MFIYKHRVLTRYPSNSNIQANVLHQALYRNELSRGYVRENSTAGSSTDEICLLGDDEHADTLPGSESAEAVDALPDRVATYLITSLKAPFYFRLDRTRSRTKRTGWNSAGTLSLLWTAFTSCPSAATTTCRTTWPPTDIWNDSCFRPPDSRKYRRSSMR